MSRPFLRHAADAALARPALFLTVLWALLCAPWLIGSRVLPYDAAQQFYPSVAFTVQQLRQLEGPWWNPLLFGGYPQFADPQAMTFQPTVVLPMLLSSLPSMSWFTVVVLVHVLLAGLGALVVARSYGLHPASRLLFALTVMFGGVAASRMQHVPMIVSYAWLPWLWWGLRRLSQRPKPATAALAGLFGGLCALQMTQVTYLMGLAAIAYGLYLLTHVAPQDRLRYAGCLALAGVIAAVVSLPQWMATFAFLPDTNRGQLLLDDAMGGSLTWPALGTLLGADLLWARGKYVGGGDLTANYLYLGAVPLAVWVAWGRATLPQYRHQVVGAMCCMALATIYALGLRTPAYAWLYEWLPGVSMFRRPADALFLFVPAAALLAAVALESRLRGAQWRPNWAGLVVLGGLGAYAIWHGAANLGGVRSLLPLLVTALISAVAIWALRASRSIGPLTLAMLLVLFALDLGVHNVRNRYYGGSGEVRKLYEGAGLPADGVSATAPILNRIHGIVRSGVIPERAEIVGVNALVNAVGVRGVAMTGGYNPMLYAPYASAFGSSTFVGTLSERVFTELAPRYDSPAFDLLGLRVVVTRESLQGSVESNGVHWKLRESVLPRILNPTTVRGHQGALPPTAAFQATDFNSEVWLPETALAGTSCARRQGGVAQVAPVSYRANRVGIDYRAPRPAWIVLNEIDAPGWWAEVNGQEVPLLRANALFRGACVPAGAGRLTFHFSPLRMVAMRWSNGRRPESGGSDAAAVAAGVAD
ncbi:YfhO family protein [Lysobacter sp. S4-A87]|uniref:YfhO family protein n=1 Tax=Lysobacter sp. S4-A87 TaxID=2925843 RepID=UPI001F532E3C|nr:YfhO family protein [Lysobacter sp. S4-A87]UNK50017.1 YfhO family protein [Lysobacter sp. S4-A87]